MVVFLLPCQFSFFFSHPPKIFNGIHPDCSSQSSCNFISFSDLNDLWIACHGVPIYMFFFHPTSHFCLLIWSETLSFRKRHFMMLFSKSPRLFVWQNRFYYLCIHNYIIYNICLHRLCGDYICFFCTPQYSVLLLKKVLIQKRQAKKKASNHLASKPPRPKPPVLSQLILPRIITWRIIPVSNWLGSPPFISHEQPIWKGKESLLRGLTITMVINHLLTAMILQARFHSIGV